MITDGQIADACNKAYLKAGHNAYFGNGFEAGVRFALEQVKNLSSKPVLAPVRNIMEDFRFTTKKPLATNTDAMDWFANKHFYEVFDEDAIFIEDDGSYAEVLDGKGQKWGLHASGDGDFVSHRIRFQALS